MPVAEKYRVASKAGSERHTPVEIDLGGLVDDSRVAAAEHILHAETGDLRAAFHGRGCRLS